MPTPGGLPAHASTPTAASLTEEEFGDIILKTGADGQITRLRDVARVELAAPGLRACARCLDIEGRGRASPSSSCPAPTRCSSRAPSATTMEELKPELPRGRGVPDRLRPHVVHPRVDPRGGEDAVRGDPAGRLVVVLFLQTWRASIIPLVAVPVSIVGTFAVMLRVRLLPQHPIAVRAGAGHRHRGGRRDRGGRERRAQHRAGPVAHGTRPTRRWTRSAGPIIAIALVLCAVFVPVAFLSGITGQFYRQFALTIAFSTVISAFNSLTLTPALSRHPAPAARRAARPAHPGARPAPGLAVPALQPRLQRGLGALRLGAWSGWRSGAAASRSLVYAGLLALTVFGFSQGAPRASCRTQDKAVSGRRCPAARRRDARPHRGGDLAGWRRSRCSSRASRTRSSSRAVDQRLRQRPERRHRVLPAQAVRGAHAKAELRA